MLLIAATITTAVVGVVLCQSPTQPPQDFSECGITSMTLPDDRVIAGKNVTAGDWPFLVKIVAGAEMFCTGSIISEVDVLTAAHCAPVFEQANVFVYAGTSHIYANGSFDGYTVGTEFHKARPTGVAVGIKRAQIHPTYRPAANGAPSAGLDVAVLELKQALVFNENIRKVCLAADFTEMRGHIGFVVGWGYDEKAHEARPDNAREDTIPIMSPSTCENSILYYNRTESLCAGGTNRGTQSGDSGGPLMANFRGRFFQVGVVSNGFTDKSTTGQKLDYGKYLRISQTCDFLKSATNGRANCMEMRSVQYARMH